MQRINTRKKKQKQIWTQSQRKKGLNSSETPCGYGCPGLVRLSPDTLERFLRPSDDLDTVAWSFGLVVLLVEALSRVERVAG